MTDRIDIIIPIYNTAKELLKKSIESAIAQTYTNKKVVLINDGSTNSDTIETISRYEKHPDVIVRNKTNGGVSSARNKGLEESESDYVVFLDSDDTLSPDYIERLHNVAVEKNVELVFSGKIDSVNGKNDAPIKEKYVSIRNDSDAIALNAHAFTSQGVLIKTTKAKRYRFDEKIKTMGEDTKYILYVMKEASVFFEGRGGYLYVKHSQNTTRRDDEESMNRYIDEAKQQMVLFKKILNINQETLSIVKALKLARLSIIMAQSLDRRSFGSKIKNYRDELGLKKIAIKKILKQDNISFVAKLRLLFVSSDMMTVLYYTNRAICRLRGEGNEQ